MTQHLPTTDKNDDRDGDLNWPRIAGISIVIAVHAAALLLLLAPVAPPGAEQQEEDVTRVVIIDDTRELNLGILPAPYVDQGIELNGTHWFGSYVQLDYAAHMVGGLRAGQEYRIEPCTP